MQAAVLELVRSLKTANLLHRHESPGWPSLLLVLRMMQLNLLYTAAGAVPVFQVKSV